MSAAKTTALCARARRPRGALFSVALFFIVPFLSACANYTLGTRAKPPFASIKVSPIVNDTYAPQTQALLHQQLNDTLAQESGITLRTVGADATLHVRLERYEHSIAATRPTDTVLGSAFTLRLTARCTLVNNRTGEVLFKEREVVATADAHDTGGFSAVEYQTMPVLTRELARKIRNAVTGVW
ncbi:MAG: LPS assembly lipoprotein LptE [Puniceicoccales bacterium]|jgi:hypothetical protein|nr:LPS assembly lipoprotein LptE [Puniceicoccales bacterium]